MTRGFRDDDQPAKSDLVDIRVTLVQDTHKAFLVETESANKVWVPKSQCELEMDATGTKATRRGTLTLPKWLAEEKGLV